MSTEFFKVKTHVLTATLQYLATKPYQEVAELITAIQQSEPINEHNPETPDNTTGSI